MLMMPKRLSKPLLVSALLLAGCQVELDPNLENRPYESTVHPAAFSNAVATPYVSQGYKYMVHIVSEDAGLKRQLELLTSQSKVFRVANNTDQSHLTLAVASSSSAPALSSRPHIFGVLRPASYPSSLEVKYILKDQSDEVLTKGQVIGVGPERTVVTPGQAATTNADPSAMAEVTAQLMNILFTEGEKQPWTALVDETNIDGVHLTLNLGKEAGIKQGQRFITPEGIAKAELEVITFETLPDFSNGRAMLKLVSGVLPKEDTALIPK